MNSTMFISKYEMQIYAIFLLIAGFLFLWTVHKNYSVSHLQEMKCPAIFNNASENEMEHSVENWKMVLKKLKEVVESEKEQKFL